MKYIHILFITILVYACSAPNKSEKGLENSYEEALTDEVEVIEYNNPPAEGFDQEGSDMIAMLLADKVMHAMGGRKAWDESRFLSWSFFGRRFHIWDKTTGDVRIEQPADSLTILMNINTKEGKVRIGSNEMTDSLDYYLDKGHRYWINDSYWLFMPFKLKDSGVTLRYISEDTTQTGEPADKLALNFKNVGVTPDNVYLIWVDTDSKLITQWAYYPDSTAPKPKYMNPWTDYKQYGNIMLSSGRGNLSMKDIKVLEAVPEGTFDKFDPIVL